LLHHGQIYTVAPASCTTRPGWASHSLASFSNIDVTAIAHAHVIANANASVAVIVNATSSFDREHAQG
jgi:hypothetical protein